MLTQSSSVSTDTWTLCEALHSNHEATFCAWNVFTLHPQPAPRLLWILLTYLTRLSTGSFKNVSRRSLNRRCQTLDTVLRALAGGSDNKEMLALGMDTARVLCSLPANKTVSTDWAVVQRTSWALKCCRIFWPPNSGLMPACYWLREENGGWAFLYAVIKRGSL